ncbi:hypothetical protein HUK65_13980 [Rhodobacteraceae bacterium 2376]|uniref:Uncharacterized protein n=1 Tax=Rhabdonatronobacter sediminivivens TaxID=2743469 RepID=A0A7Z0I1B4_9RHOB|nr:hypothetical protein [Rhabdonatronobacter sediminivivens]NYS26098.1 hypothetical protein [Rhabdonatronobacter sediminivivens]
MTATTVQFRKPRAGNDGLIGLWGRLIHRDPESYDIWLEERDMTIITAALMRLNERQLNRLGLSRATLALDVEDLTRRAERDAELTADILRIVEDSDRGPEHRHSPATHAIAAE